MLRYPTHLKLYIGYITILKIVQMWKKYLVMNLSWYLFSLSVSYRLLTFHVAEQLAKCYFTKVKPEWVNIPTFPQHVLREADCEHQALDGNSKICILFKLSWFKAFNKRRRFVKKNSRPCWTVLEISKHLLMQWQTVLDRLKFILLEMKFKDKIHLSWNPYQIFDQ